MGGNVVEWVLDVYSPNSVPSCDNCALLTAPDGGDAAVRGQRGGSFVSDSNGIRGAFRGRSPAFERSPVAGVRCARVP
jgi:formylglycine-generating enzyme required for sulfatase activity